MKLTVLTFALFVPLIAGINTPGHPTYVIELDEARHDDPPIPEHVEADEDGNPDPREAPQASGFCNPLNGYFGSTSGSSTFVNYVFGLETKIGANVGPALDAVAQRVQDILLATTFPDLCDSRMTSQQHSRSGLDSAIQGFHFDPDSYVVSGDFCDPVANGQCVIYEGRVEVFGDATGVLETIEFYLSESNGPELNSDILRVFAIGYGNDSVTEPVDAGTDTQPATQGNDDGLPAGAVAGIVLALLGLFVGVGGIVYFERKRRRNSAVESKAAYTHNGTVWSQSNDLGVHEGESEFVTVDLHDVKPRSSIVIEDGRPTLSID